MVNIVETRYFASNQKNNNPKLQSGESNRRNAYVSNFGNPKRFAKEKLAAIIASLQEKCITPDFSLENRRIACVTNFGNPNRFAKEKQAAIIAYLQSSSDTSNDQICPNFEK